MTRCLPAFLALALALPAAAAGKDRVFKKGDPKPLEGTVEKEDWKEVTIKLEGQASSSVPWDKLDRIEYGDAPLPYRDAMGLMQKGNKAEAAGAFAKAAEGLKEKPIFLAQCLYYAGLCRQHTAQYDDAIRSYQDLTKALPNNRFFKDAWNNLIECFLLKGDSKGAKDAIGAADAAGKEINVDEEFLVILSLKQAQVLEADKDYPSAIGKYQSVASKPGDKFKPIKGQAMLGVARCQMQQNPATAQATYEQITVQYRGVRSVLGPAFAGLGDCLFQQAQKSGEADQLRKAALAYEQSSVLWFPGDGASTAAHEAALVGGGEVFLLLAETAQGNDKARALYANQSKSMLINLLDLYPGSSLKAKADELRGKAEEILSKLPK